MKYHDQRSLNESCSGPVLVRKRARDRKIGSTVVFPWKIPKKNLIKLVELVHDSPALLESIDPDPLRSGGEVEV